MEFDRYAGLLKMHDDFSRSTLGNRRFTYNFHHPGWIELKSRYPIRQVAGDGDDFSRAANLLRWLSGNTSHKGDYDNHISENAVDLLDYTFGHPAGRGVNCRALSIILTECCLAVGLPARTVSIIPASPYDSDSHVVVIVYVRHPGKWVMMDPSWNAFCLDEGGVVLNPWEIRTLLADRGNFRLNPDVLYNDHHAHMEETVAEYGEYLAKDLFYLHCPLDSTYDPEHRSPPVFMAPGTFDVHRHRLVNIEYRINRWGTHPMLENWLSDAKNGSPETIYASQGEFASIPDYLTARA